MRTIIIKKENEVYLKLELDRAQALELSSFMSKKADNYLFSPAYRCGRWDGSIYYFNKLTNELPIGLLPQLVSFCEKFRYTFKFDFDYTTLGDNIKEETLEQVYDYLFPPTQDMTPRYYQKESIIAALNNKRGIARLSVGAGKSLIQYILIRYLLAKNKKILMIVPSVSLVEQMYSDFKDYGWEDEKDFVDKLYSGQELTGKPVLISTYQSLAKKSPEFFNKFDAVIVDEVHSAKAISIQQILKHCKNAEYRIGLTGTLPSNDADKWTLFGFIGPVIYDLSSKELIDQGILSQISINNLILKYPNSMLKSRIDYQQEVKDIIDYKNRNKALDYIIENSDKSHNTLILVQRIEHLKEVREYLQTKYSEYTVYDIYGDTEASHREKIRKEIELKGSVLLVATFSTLSQGVNIKRLHNIVFFSSYKSEIKIIQSIGRGLRKHDTKEKMILWDCVDDLRYRDGNKMIKNYAYKHWTNRKSYYEEQGFSYTDISINI